jgi:hypothetical protein
VEVRQLATAALLREQVDRVVEEVVEPDPGRLLLGVVVAEDDRDLGLTGPEEVERVRRMHVGEADLKARVALGQGRHRSRPEVRERGGEAGKPHAACVQPDVCRQLSAGRVDPSDDLGGADGEQLAGRREPDAAADPLQQLRARFRLEPRDVMGDRRLRVVQLLGGGGHRSVPGDGIDHAQAVDVEHSSTLSIGRRESRH